MKIQGTQIERKQCCVEVDPRECLKALIEECGVPYDVFEKDGKFVKEEDISGHGRPVYEYENFEVSTEKAALLRTLLQAKKDMISAGMANSINFY